MGKCKVPQIAKTILKSKNKTGGLTLPQNLLLSYNNEDVVVLTSRKTLDQWNQI